MKTQSLHTQAYKVSLSKTQVDRYSFNKAINNYATAADVSVLIGNYRYAAIVGLPCSVNCRSMACDEL